MDATASFTRSNPIPISLRSIDSRDIRWLIPCILSLWLIGIILGFDDSGRLFRGNDPAAPTVAAWGLALGVFGIWRWRRWLIRDELLRPAHDAADDLLWLLGTLGALFFYFLLIPSRRYLAPNLSLCLFSGLAGARLVYSGMTRRIGDTLHCSRCNYQIIDTSLPRRCPECAGVWAHRLLRGRIVRSTKLISAGIILLFICTFAPIPRLEVGRAFIRRQMATAWIFSEATKSLKENYMLDAELWRELSKRKLTDQQAQSLADLVLRGTANNSLRDNGAYRWLEDLVFSGQAPRTAADGFMDLSLAFQIVAPRSSFAGSPVPVTIQALELRRVPRDRIAVCLEWLRDDADPTPILNYSKWETLANAMLLSSRDPVAPSPTPQAALLAQPRLSLSENLGLVATPALDRLGGHRLQARIWVAIVPPGAPPVQSPATLAPLYADPTVKPPVAWLKQYDVGASVQVSDRRGQRRPAPPKSPN
ncbi:MAG: hypothetical protein KF691_13255 [Phycisphaeraceae bacterium]|nr:hypothetical protein [Phycisphaeraceae bacterium]